MTTPGPLSGLILEVPEAEPAVRPHRERLDINTALGVPAHITVLFPFMPPERIDAAVLERLELLFAATERFTHRLDHTGWFGGDVLWLGPADPGPFRALTAGVHRAFPAFPPFEGRFSDVVPHLTIGHGRPLSELRAAENAVRPHLPIDARAIAVTLMTQQTTGGPWTTNVAFPLA